MADVADDQSLVESASHGGMQVCPAAVQPREAVQETRQRVLADDRLRKEDSWDNIMVCIYMI